MSTVIGGPFKCLLHDVETDDINEWNEHCLSTEGHTETGDTACTNCGVNIHFENIPFQKITTKGKNIELKCQDCFNNSQDLNKMIYSQQNQSGGNTQQ